MAGLSLSCGYRMLTLDLRSVIFAKLSLVRLNYLLTGHAACIHRFLILEVTVVLGQVRLGHKLSFVPREIDLRCQHLANVVLVFLEFHRLG